jgi:hypothetical protein
MCKTPTTGSSHIVVSYKICHGHVESIAFARVSVLC